MQCTFGGTQGEMKELSASEFLLCPHNRRECDQADGCNQIKQNIHSLVKPPANVMDRANCRMR